VGSLSGVSSLNAAKGVAEWNPIAVKHDAMAQFTALFQSLFLYKHLPNWNTR